MTSRIFFSAGRVLTLLLMIFWLANVTAETQRKISLHFSAAELEQQPDTVSFNFYDSKNATIPFFVETYYPSEWDWQEAGSERTVTTFIDAAVLQAEGSTWFELVANNKVIGGRQKLLSIDPNNPDFSVEGYIETRAGGIKFADQSLQTTAVSPTSYQQRVNGSCAAGSSIASINQDGSVSCQTDNDSGGTITEVTAGSGLSGGGVSGSVALAVDTAVIQQRVATACPSGQSIRSINQDGSVVCVTGGSTPVPPLCNGTNQALQWDGAQYTCVDIRQLGASTGAANGFELTDPENETWDGFQRPKLGWADAKLACETVGGRLPTITELFRNNALTGSGSLSNPDATDYYWTLIAGVTGYHAAVRLSDGQLLNYTNNNLLSYRCVWPDVSDALFTENNCYSKTGSCEQTGLIWNLDETERPSMNYQNAVNECNFYGASVPTVRDLSEFIHQTNQSGTNSWLWAADAKYWYPSYMGVTLLRWSGQDPAFSYQVVPVQTGAYNEGKNGTNYSVRCIGKNSSVGQLPSPICEGGCSQLLEGRRSRLIADISDRAALGYADAAESCRLLGGSLPNSSELTDLIHAGLANGSNSWLWSSDPLYWHNSNKGTLGYRWFGTGTDDWTPAISTTQIILAATGSRPYRCIWNEKLEATATVCAADEQQNWNGNSFDCTASVNGTSGGTALPSEFIDAWGNAWDSGTQAAVTYADAINDCSVVGARLPTATEIYRLRANQAVAGVTPIGTVGETAYLWTNIVAETANQLITVRVSDGNATAALKTNTSSYRCVWPASKGNVLAGRSCYGEPANGCYQTGDMRTDDFDRVALPQASASNECEFYGGRLPDLDEFQELIHSGTRNGTNSWLWINESMYWYNGGYGYAWGKWVGTGDATWVYNSASGNAAVASNNNYAPFRCVFSTRMN